MVVESEFNQDLIIKPTRQPNLFLALVRTVQARSGRGFLAFVAALAAKAESGGFEACAARVQPGLGLASRRCRPGFGRAYQRVGRRPAAGTALDIPGGYDRRSLVTRSTPGKAFLDVLI
jgi:hypothetical protein